MIFKRNPKRNSHQRAAGRSLILSHQETAGQDHIILTYNQMIIDMECLLSQPGNRHLTLQHALNISQQKAVETGMVNQQEAQEIASYIKMDVNDVADCMMESSAECYDWLMLDIEMIELKVLEKYLSAARQARMIMNRITSQR